MAVDTNALRSEVRAAIINQKANACPIACRLAWHSSGTYTKATGKYGSNGSTMYVPAFDHLPLLGCF